MKKQKNHATTSPIPNWGLADVREFYERRSIRRIGNGIFWPSDNDKQICDQCKPNWSSHNVCRNIFFRRSCSISCCRKYGACGCTISAGCVEPSVGGFRTEISTGNQSTSKPKWLIQILAKKKLLRLPLPLALCTHRRTTPHRRLQFRTQNHGDHLRGLVHSSILQRCVNL